MKVGILGNGQLARMLALAGKPLGLDCVFLAPGEGPCVTGLGAALQGGFEERAALDALLTEVDRITVEREDIPVRSLEVLQARKLVAPGPLAVAIAQERLLEKELFRRQGIPTAPYGAVDSLADLHDAVAQIGGLPALLKTRRAGYDGKGQWRLTEPSDLPRVWPLLGNRAGLLEGIVPFDRELSIIGVRTADGECRFWPVTENHHHEGILRWSLSRPDDPHQARAEDFAKRLMVALDYVGVLALELFVVGDQLVANEFAPRVHNSGHWTIEGAVTSQFENHLRAVAGLPLGQTTARGYTAMVNILGRMPRAGTLLALPGVHLHCYGKSPAPGRKLGHVTVCANEPQDLQRQLSPLLRLLGPATEPDMEVLQLA